MGSPGWRRGFASILAALTGSQDGTFDNLKFFGGARPGTVLSSGVINLAATSSDNNIGDNGTALILPGKFFIYSACRVWFTDLNGSLTSGPTIRAGNNAAKNNMILDPTVQPTLANINAIGATVPAPGGQTSITVANALPVLDLSTAIKLDVTAAAVLNTATLCHAKFLLWGALVS